MIAAKTAVRHIRTGALVVIMAFCTRTHGGQDPPDGEAAAGEAAAENNLQLVPPALRSLETGDNSYERVIFGGRGESAAGVRLWLDALLLRKVETVDRFSRLTEPQKQKLHLAGRGDIKRFFDSVEEQRRQIVMIDENALDRKKIDEITQAAHQLRHVLDLGPFEEGSLFAKAVRRTLSPQQAGRGEFLRESARAGGLMESQNIRGRERHTIELSATGFADDGLKNIPNLENLRELALDGSQVTDAGMRHLAGLESLEILDMSDTAVTDAGLAHLKGLIGLRVVYLTGLRITNAGLAQLKLMKRLEVLDLARTRVTDAGLAHLQGLMRLKRLDLTGLDATDTGVASLRGLTELERLVLTDTKITDAGLRHLYGLTKLKRLDLFGVEVTQTGLADLQQALPGVKLFR
jgi:Leucine-rich repeat (LRR) protein